MSRIYLNNKLENLKLTNLKYPTLWNEKNVQQGSGTLIEATVETRFHYNITDSNNHKYKYYLFVLKVERSHKRVFEGQQEIEPNFSATEKVRTGYLNSSYKTTSKGKSDILTTNELINLTQNNNLLNFIHADNQSLKDKMCILLEEKLLDRIEFSDGDRIRVRTKGNGPFVESLGRIDQTTVAMSSYAGDEDTAWVDKMMKVNAGMCNGGSNVKPNKENDAVNEDEWND